MEQDPSDFDFPCSPTWRRYYNERYGYAGIDYNYHPPNKADWIDKLAAMERHINHLYALEAMRQVEKREAKPKAWQPSDGLAKRP